MKELATMPNGQTVLNSLHGLTIKSYQTKDLDQFLDFLKAHGYGLAEGLAPYLKHLRTDGWIDRNGIKHEYQASSMRIKFNAAKRLGDYVIEHHGQAFDTATLLYWERVKRIIKGPETAPGGDDKHVSWTEVQRLITHTLNEKLTLIMAFLAQTACSVSEALTVRRNDITKHDTHYQIHIHGKGRRERRVVAETAVIEKIVVVFASKTWLFEHNARTYNANSITTRIKATGCEILGKDISAHTFRHSWVAEQLKQGRSLDEISKYLGHASTSITAGIYAHNTTVANTTMTILPLFAKTAKDGIAGKTRVTK